MLPELLPEQACVSLRDVKRDTEGKPIRSGRKKQTTKIDLEVPESSLVAQHRSNLTYINNKLRQHCISLDLSNEHLMQLHKEMSQADSNDTQGAYRSVHLQKVQLTRIFSRGSMELGGRFYRGWWQSIPSTHRPHIRIDGKKTIEVDYSGMCLRILYALAGQEMNLETDPYDIGLDNWVGRNDNRRSHIKKIINALINAVKNGKDVTVLIELRARFDEHNNIRWSQELEEEGVKVNFGLRGLKVHSKLILVKRKEGRGETTYVHVGTGNFHEKTAKIYSDASLLTSDKRIANDIEKVFDFVERPYINKRFNNIIISPYNTRTKFVQLINQEIRNAKKGKPAKIIIKLNNFNDPELIKKFYEASCEGVEIKMIIRGICSLVPGVKDLSENIEVISIIDRYLEHVRMFHFHNDGNELFFIGSADWLVRNLDRRVEVTTPIYDKEIQNNMREFLNLQLKDNVKARIIDEKGKNKYVPKKGRSIRSQTEQYKYFKSLLD